jgi:hypothetical protein
MISNSCRIIAVAPQIVFQACMFSKAINRKGRKDFSQSSQRSAEQRFNFAFFAPFLTTEASAKVVFAYSAVKWISLNYSL